MGSETRSPLEGKILDGRIEIVRDIGRGGFGSIYEARHKLFGRTVALKVIETGDPAARDRLRAEARAIAQIRSPHVVALIDFGFDETLQVPYLAMELVDGVPVSALPRPMPWREAADLAVQLLSAIEAAHTAGVVHRDLKPSNVLIASRKSGERIVKVLDFGVSRLLFLDARITRTGELVGTPAYMAPEQIQSDEIDGRVDVWSAGVILYELLAGRRPFDAEEPVAIFRQILKEEPPRLEDLAPSAAPLAPIVRRALAKDRNARFASAEEMKSEMVALTTLRAQSRASAPQSDPVMPVPADSSAVDSAGLDPTTLPRTWRSRLGALAVAVAAALIMGWLASPNTTLVRPGTTPAQVTASEPREVRVRRMSEMQVSMNRLFDGTNFRDGAQLSDEDAAKIEAVLDELRDPAEPGTNLLVRPGAAFFNANPETPWESVNGLRVFVSRARIDRSGRTAEFWGTESLAYRSSVHGFQSGNVMVMGLDDHPGLRLLGRIRGNSLVIYSLTDATPGARFATLDLVGM